MALPAAITPSGDVSAALFTAVIPARLRGAIAAASAGVADDIRGLLPEFYPGTLALRWTVTTAPGPIGAGSVITVATDDRRVLWYEYGTRPHEILPRNVRALHWEKPSSVFAARVHHPGTPAHNRLPDLQAALDELALTAWGDAIDAVFASIDE